MPKRSKADIRREDRRWKERQKKRSETEEQANQRRAKEREKKQQQKLKETEEQAAKRRQQHREVQSKADERARILREQQKLFETKPASRQCDADEANWYKQALEAEGLRCPQTADQVHPTEVLDAIFEKYSTPPADANAVRAVVSKTGVEKWWCGRCGFYGQHPTEFHRRKYHQYYWYCEICNCQTDHKTIAQQGNLMAFIRKKPLRCFYCLSWRHHFPRYVTWNWKKLEDEDLPVCMYNRWHEEFIPDLEKEFCNRLEPFGSPFPKEWIGHQKIFPNQFYEDDEPFAGPMFTDKSQGPGRELVFQEVLAKKEQLWADWLSKMRAARDAMQQALKEMEKHCLYTTTVRSGEMLAILEVTIPHICPIERKLAFRGFSDEEIRGPLMEELDAAANVMIFGRLVDPCDPTAFKNEVDKKLVDNKFIPPIWNSIFVPFDQDKSENTWQKRVQWGEQLAKALDDTQSVRFGGDFYSVHDESRECFLSDYLTLESTMFALCTRHNICHKKALLDPELMSQYYAPDVLDAALHYDNYEQDLFPN